MSTLHIRLNEWQRRGPGEPDDTDLRGRRLANASARALAARLTTERVLGITELHDGISVESYSYVGRIEVGDLTVTVEPKLAAQDLLKLVRYAFGLRDLRLEHTAAFAGGLGLLQDLLIAQLHAEVRELVARGLRRRYVTMAEELASPRGRIDMTQMAGVRAATSATLPCRHHPRSSDFLLNQVLVTGLQLAAGLASDPRLRLEVHRLAASLTDAVGPVSLNTATLVHARRSLNRMVARYEPALQLVELLYACSSVSLDNGSALRLPGFLFDLNLARTTRSSRNQAASAIRQQWRSGGIPPLTPRTLVTLDDSGRLAPRPS